ncbi:MAG: putative nitrogen regulatory PII-like protein [Methanocorpusculum sp. MCE]|nr:MAG: putative nitrogen regulatory PII-like protein [Methanocorpusculum sp. MCE]
MKEILAFVRMNKTNATKRALLSAKAAGFIAMKVEGRGKQVTDRESLTGLKNDLMAKGQFDDIDDMQEGETLVEGFLDDSRMFARRMFLIVCEDDEVDKLVKAIIDVNKTSYKMGDGKIFVLPLEDAVRVRTGETGSAAL